MVVHLRSILVATVGLLSVAVIADDSYFRLRPNELVKDKAGLTTHFPVGVSIQQPGPPATQPRVILNGPGEAYFHRESWICIRAPSGKNLEGRLLLPGGGPLSGTWSSSFRVPASAADRAAEVTFRQAKADYYDQLARSGIPGTAWFRHQVRAIRTGLDEAVENSATSPPAEGSDQRLYDYFTGHRAVLENLQLDRPIENVIPSGRKRATATIQGVTTRPIDWGPLVAGLHPDLDPLALLIPADQHAVFFASIEQATIVANAMRRNGTILMRILQPRCEDANAIGRYEEQLSLSLDDASKLLTSDLAQTLALTGSDIDFVMGTDVAVLIESDRSRELAARLLRQITATASQRADAESLKGMIENVPYRGFRTADRRVCCYLAQLPNAVCLTNSPYQLERIAKTAANRRSSLAALPEYVFFRDRYPCYVPEETAFVILSDATVRRWCGPRWRIGAARRVRQMASLLEVQAKRMTDILRVDRDSRLTVLGDPDDGPFQLGASGVVSDQGDTLSFLTPIAEMPLDAVTHSEAAAYVRWRQAYETSWSRRRFDPIALRVTIWEDQLATDLSVIPLSLLTEYSTVVSIAAGAKGPLVRGDPHDTLVHFGMAINKESPIFQYVAHVACGVFNEPIEGKNGAAAEANPLGWIGDSIEFYVDNSPFWTDLAAVEPGQRVARLQNQSGQLPSALRLAINDSDRATRFLAALRRMLETRQPSALVWDALQHHEKTYWRVTATEQGRKQLLLGYPIANQNIAVYYAVLDDALVVSLSEDLIQRVFDRQQARREAVTAGQQPVTEGEKWLGNHLGLHVHRHLLDHVVCLDDQKLSQAWMQSSSWNNLPILNEWRRRYPDQNPLDVHWRVWKTRLICPGGGEYVWNDEWQTMESTVYGHPCLPRKGPEMPPLLRRLQDMHFGLTMEHEGLRARVVLNLQPHETPEDDLRAEAPGEKGANNDTSVPVLAAPHANATLSNEPIAWTFQWCPVPGAMRYHLYVHRQGSPFPVVDQPNLTETSFTLAGGHVVSGLRYNWRWRVRVETAAGWSDWSEERRFQVAPTRAAP